MAEQVPSPDKPPINLSHTRVFCARHGEPLRAQWPKGFAMFSIRLFQAAMATEEMSRELGDDNSPANIERVLDRKPMCCRVGNDALLEIYGETGIGVNKICTVCMRAGPGTPYRTMDPKGHVKNYQHVCFECVLNRMVSFRLN